MTKSIKIFSRIALLMVALIVTVGLSACSGSSAAVTKKQGANIVPTLFFHGYGGSINGEKQMANASVKVGASKTIIQAIVDKNGRVTLKGTIPASDKNPIVQVGYEDNRNPNFHQDATWAKNVVVKLQQQYHIKKFNMVGHSMGNMSIMFYTMDNYQNKKLPQLQKQVDLAGHFNGIVGREDNPNQIQLKANGDPETINDSYRQLLPIRDTNTFKNIDVLNIFGDKGDGSHSDGSVTNESSQSLRYLVSEQAKSYREVKITGKNASHSALHENKQVDRILIQFLWGK